MTFGSLRTDSARAVGDLDAVVEHDDVVGNLHDHGHVVLDQEHRCPVLVADAQEQLVQLGRFARIQAGGRLVEAEELRVGAHGAGDLEPSLRAIGEVGRRIVGAVDKPDLLEPGARLLDRLGLGALVAGKTEDAEDRHAGGDHQPVVLRDHQVFQHRHAAEEADVLKGARDLCLGGDAVVRHALEQKLGAARLPQRDPTLARLVEAGDAVEDGGLAGAVRADQPVMSPRSAWNDTSLTASRPPKRMVRCSTVRIGSIGRMSCPASISQP